LACALWDPDHPRKSNKIEREAVARRMMFSRIDSLRALAAARLMVVVTWVGTIDDRARPNSSRQHTSGERNETRY